MRQIDLEENQRSRPHLLSESQREALGEIRLGERELLVIERADVTDSEVMYCLTPGSIVGAVEVDDLSVRVKPKIGIQQLLSLSCYAFDQVELQPRNFNFSEEESLPDFLAHALTGAARRAFSRGLLRGYLTREEALYALRGRILFEEQMRRRFGIPMPVEVRHDEFTDDITANRLIKAAAHLLGMMRLRSLEARNGLVQIAAMLDQVSLADFSTGQVPKVQFDQLNEHYREVIALSRIILQHSAYQLGRATVRAPGLLVDMNSLFQEFVTVALRKELGVSEERFGESVIDTLDVPATGDRGKVGLRPDLVWREGSRCVFVGDVKYKNIDSKPVPNSDLYQMLAYITALDLPAGLIIYAKGEVTVAKYPIRRSSKLLEVSALDLSGPLERVFQKVSELAQEVRRLRSAVMSEAA